MAISLGPSGLVLGSDVFDSADDFGSADTSYIGHKMLIMNQNNQANFSIDASAYSALVILVETNDAGRFRVNSAASDFNVATQHTSGAFNPSKTGGNTAYHPDWGSWSPPNSQGTEAANSFILSKANPTSGEGFSIYAWGGSLRAKMTFWGVT